MQILLDPHDLDSYRTFLAVKRLPAFTIRGRVAEFPDEYASRLGLAPPVYNDNFSPGSPLLTPYDYQLAITRTAIERRKYAVFADCGLGKTIIILMYARYVQELVGPLRRVLILTPPLVVPQLIEEAKRFYGEDFPIERVRASELSAWLAGEHGTPGAIGVANYEALKTDTPQGNLAALICDESSILKSHYGNYASIVLRLGRGLEWKLCCTGTPAPNDRIEYANHAVFLDRFPTVNSFLAKYFVNRGQTGERWELKPHALRPFYRSLSDWCIFLSDPSVYGWKDNATGIPPIHTHIHDVPLTSVQREWVYKHLGSMFATHIGGITKRSALSQVSKGHWKGVDYETNKYGFIAGLVGQWRKEESTILWCLYDHEQQKLHKAVGGASMSGKTPMAERLAQIHHFKAGKITELISKPRILGFGLNLQKATRQVFSGLQDSYEQFWQCAKRSNRVGSTRPLNLHIPATELEMPMIENVLRKAHRVETDTREQEQLFRELAMGA